MQVAIDPNRLLRKAEGHFAAGHLTAARPLIEQVLRLVPGHPAVLHLHGLILSGLGELIAARGALEAARQGLPRDHQVANNLGNLLGKLGEQTAALTAYDAAIRLDPAFRPARLNRAITLDQLGRYDEARAELTALAAIAAPTAETLVAAASIERNSGDLIVAATRLDEALAIDPGHVAARRVRARLALDMGETDAEARHRAALDATPGDRELQLSYLAAAETEDARRDSVVRVRAALAADPLWLDGHGALASALWAAGDRAGFVASYETALATAPKSIALWAAHISAVGTMGDFAGAAEVCARAEAATGDPRFAMAAFGYRSAAGDVAGVEAILRRLPVAPTPVALAKHRLRLGDPATAERLLAEATEAAPDDIEAWALRGVAWQALGDARFHWLHGQDGLIGIHELPFTAEDTAQMATILRALHEQRSEPLGQSVRGGSQTGGNLFDRRAPAIARLRDEIVAAVARHRAALPPADPRHPLLRHRDADLALDGSWSVRFVGGGRHIPHIHPKGILSAASYWAVPASDGQAGWLELGGAPEYLALALPPLRRIEPRPGRLVLFPSTLHHGTRPFGSGERISVAFDVVARQSSAETSATSMRLP